MIVVAAVIIFILSGPPSFNTVCSKHLPVSNSGKLPPALEDEIHMTTTEIIRKYNYSAEEHPVTTEDGYILTLHRMYKVRKANKGAVLVMHGIVSSSTDWIICGPKNGLGYILADEGYDVWLGNARGNRYSRNHTFLDPNKRDFWRFSWHQIGYYDTPAMINHILEATGEQKIFHVAHSQGTTSFYAMLSLRPEYNDKIRTHISLAPVAFVKHLRSPLIRILARHIGLVGSVAELIGVDELLPTDGFISQIGYDYCGVNSISETLCKNVLFAICGFNYKELNSTILPLILAHVPAGSSARQLMHYGQEINSGRFRQYDFGIFGNLREYGSVRPPDYNLSNVQAPVYFFYSKNDWISNPRDVEKLSGMLGNFRGKFLLSDDDFNHLDYMFGIQAPTILYNKVISLLARH